MFCFPRRSRSRDAPPPAAQSPPEDVRALFSRHKGLLRDHIDGDDLRRCLGDKQGEEAKADSKRKKRGGKGQGLEDDGEDDTGTGGGGPSFPSQRQFSLDDFHRILFSHDINPPIRRRGVHHDMTLPLSHYFIYSGHNPYYAMLGSSSGRSDEAIIRALKMGVRAIEVAMWPNSKEDDIKIYHGWTKENKPVLLTECLKSIKENAFVASRYPVIITLEDNLQSSRLQKKAAKVMLDVLGDILYWPHADYITVRGNGHSNNKPLEDFPSPDELMGAVVLSTKPPASFLKKDKGKPLEVHGTIEQGDDDQLHGRKGADDDDDAAWGPEVPVFQTKNIQSDDSDYQKRDDGVVLVQPRRHNNDYDDGYPLYHHLITIRPDNLFPRGRLGTNKTTERVSTLEMEPPDIDVLQVRRFSWSNKQQIEKAAEYRGTDIVRFTQRNLLWIYPSVSIKGSPRDTLHVIPSNYNPFLGWVHGAQMVALNMQEYGRALWLMHGFYRANGGCGYVRKPDFLMQRLTEVFDPRKRQPVKKTLKVKVYMGDGWLTDFKHAHTSFIPDLWASVGIAGVPADTTAMKNTKATEKTWVPLWEEEFSFPLTVPEIALLRLEVHQYDASEKDVFGGQTVLPVWELRPGIRAVALFDRQGNRLPNVKLLTRFEFVSAAKPGLIFTRVEEEEEDREDSMLCCC